MISQHAVVIAKIRAAKGATKQSILRSQSDLTTLDILIATYHPHRHYFFNKVPWKGEGDLVIDTSGFKILNDLADRKLSGHAASLAVKRYMENLKPEEADIFKCILKKDLRMGMGVKTINKALHEEFIPEFAVMLASKFEKSMWRKDLYASVKLDGLRAFWDGQKMYTRRGFEIIGIDHITRNLPSFSLDGELVIPGVHFQVSSGKIRSFDPTPNAVYYIFDVPNSNPFYERYLFMYDLAKEFNWGFNIPKPAPITMVKHKIFKSYDEMDLAFQRVLNAGYEGLVLKSPNALYQNKRSKDWMKVKNTLSEDLTIIGFFEGQGKYANSLGGIVVERPNGTLVKVGSGFTDAQRDSIWHNQDHYLDLTGEIQYHEETPDGSLRHPRFKGFRIDK